MLRILTWNLHGQVPALEAILDELGARAEPTVAVLTEVPDAQHLLGSAARGHQAGALDTWIAGRGSSAKVATLAMNRGTARMKLLPGQTGPARSNQNHTVILYRGPGAHRALGSPPERSCVAVVDVLPRKLLVVGVHAKPSSEYEGRTGPAIAASNIAKQLEKEPDAVQIIAGDLNENPFHSVIMDWDGFHALPAQPPLSSGRRRGPPRASALANLTWQAIRWKSRGTFRDDNDRWHWFDQILVDAKSAETASHVDVIETLGGTDVFRYSDHAPLEAVLNLNVEIL